MNSAELLVTERAAKLPHKTRPLDIHTRVTVQRILKGHQSVLITPAEPQPRPRAGSEYILWRGKKLDLRSADLFKACPFGQTMERLYVREPWLRVADSTQRILLAADYGHWNPFQKTRWRATSRMPAEAARLFLRVDSVALARLHELPQEDLRDTGLRLGMTHYEGQIQNVFQGEWDDTQKRSRRWDKNPWVWRVRFTRVPTL
jgi:hypothetical protein